MLIKLFSYFHCVFSFEWVGTFSYFFPIKVNIFRKMLYQNNWWNVYYLKHVIFISMKVLNVFSRKVFNLKNQLHTQIDLFLFCFGFPLRSIRFCIQWNLLNQFRRVRDRLYPCLIIIKSSILYSAGRAYFMIGNELPLNRK